MFKAVTLVTQGTKVLVGDIQIPGITRIELVCEVNDIWRARIDLNVQATDLNALSVFHQFSRWQRLMNWWRELVRPVHGFDFRR